MRIAVDGMGGDHAPQAVLEGIQMTLDKYPDLEYSVYGDESRLKEVADQIGLASPKVQFVHAPEVITGEDDPVKAVRRKKSSSMVMAAESVKEGSCDLLLSAGNTGALLAAGLLVVGRMPGIERPGLMPILPTINPDHPHLLLMDAGANAESKPTYLHQFALLAHVYAEQVLKIAHPRVGLINNGTEAGKGDSLRKEAYALLASDSRLNFVGNLEAKEILNGQVDIAVTDGFTGNAILKSIEGTAKSIMKLMKSQILEGGLKTKIGGLLIKDAMKEMAGQLDDTKQGGAVFLGVQKPVIKAHGSSNSEAISNAIGQAHRILTSGAIEAIQMTLQSMDVSQVNETIKSVEE